MLAIKNPGGKWLPALLALALLAGCMPAGPRALWDGKKLIDRRRYGEAVARLRLACSLMPTNAQAWNYLGLASHLAGQFSNAIPAYQKALALDPDLLEAHYNLGCLWAEQGRLEPAKSELTTYVSLRRNSPEGWTKLGAVELHQAAGEGHASRAGAAAREQELAAAERCLNEALRLSPAIPEALNDLGVVRLLRRRQAQEAVRDFNAALKQQPGYAPAVLNLAVVSQVYLNDLPSALQKYRQYLALAAPGPEREAVDALARALEARLNAARPAANTADPPSVPTPASRNRTLSTPAAKSAPAQLTLASNSSAAAEKNRAGATNSEAPPTAAPAPTPKPAMPPPRLAKLNPVAGHDSRPATGLASLETQDSSSGGIRRYPYRFPAKPLRGNHAAAERAFADGVRAQQSDRITEAVDFYREAVELDPAYYDAYYNLGLAAAQSGNLRLSLVSYETALAIRPDSRDARYNFALVLKQDNYPLDAARELERLVTLDAGEVRPHLALGNLYAQQLGQPAKAREQYAKVLELDPGNPQAGSIRYWMEANPL